MSLEDVKPDNAETAQGICSNWNSCIVDSMDEEEETEDNDLLAKKSKEELLLHLNNVVVKKNDLHQLVSCLQEELKSLKCENLKAIGEAELKNKLDQSEERVFMLQNQLKLENEKNLETTEKFTLRFENCLKQCEKANKDKEAMVINYAMAEKEVLRVKKEKENVEKRLRELEKDKDILQGKIKVISSEKSKLNSLLESKIHEYGLAIRTIDKLKEELTAKDIKIKWTQTKLKTEMDANAEIQEKLDKVLLRLCNHEGEMKATRQQADSLVKETKESENSRANILEKQLAEAKANLILEKEKLEESSVLYKRLKTEHDSLLRSFAQIENEATILRQKVIRYESEREESEKLFVSLQSEVKSAKQEAADLSHSLSTSAALMAQLDSEKSRVELADRTAEELRAKLQEEDGEMAKCREKEAELLSFTQKLTDTNAMLQSQVTALQGKLDLVEVEDGEMKRDLQKLKGDKMALKKQLSHLQIKTEEERNRLQELLTAKTEAAETLQIRVLDLVNDSQVQQKRQLNASKDSSREIQKLRKKLDALEKSPNLRENCSLQPTDQEERAGADGTPNDTLSQDSSASSETSLNTMDATTFNGIVVTSKSLPQVSFSDLPQQVLIERIIDLQKSLAKKSEKIEFLEEHIEQLLNELKKKKSIICHYIMKEEPGALAGAKSDSAKSFTSRVGKKSQVEIMKYGGIMASVYGSVLKDDTMTLDLSLEINRKLQAVLEDTLLKNITLKENLNTLGDEVAKLAIQNKGMPCRRS